MSTGTWMRGGSHDEIRVAAGISYRQLDYWCRQGHIPGVHNDLAGRGQRREFTSEARRRILTLSRLTGAGLALDVAAKVAPALERTGSAEHNGVLIQLTDDLAGAA